MPITMHNIKLIKIEAQYVKICENAKNKIQFFQVFQVKNMF